MKSANKAAGAGRSYRRGYFQSNRADQINGVQSYDG